MKIDALVFEIGSTTTTVSAFDKLHSEHPVFLGQGFAPTTVEQNDVTIGLEMAKNHLMQNLNLSTLEAKETYACSSAAGGLKMSVHGLVYDMTVKAAKEAALGAGANILQLTAGPIQEHHLSFLEDHNINIVLIAGGVDYGETETVYNNAKAIAELRRNIPVIYAGNIANQQAVLDVFQKNFQDQCLSITPNVYPRIDQLNVEPIRKIIQDVFEGHITKAPGMEKIKTVINQSIMPVPAAVLQASVLLQQEIGDLLVLDVGGATTDVHSVTEGTTAIQLISIQPEPFSKRTVEGDLGVYVNRNHLIQRIGPKTIQKALQVDENKFHAILEEYTPIPTTEQIPLVQILTKHALIDALNRHAGRYFYTYGLSGRKKFAEGKDLTNIQTIIGTGGALTRLPGGTALIYEAIKSMDPLSLKPSNEVTILIDDDYTMAAIGVLSINHPIAAVTLLKNRMKKGEI